MAWHVSPGDVVALNQALCTVETAKAEVELPSPLAGRVVARHAEIGEVVPVGAVIVEVDTAPGGAGHDGDGASGPVLVGYGTAPRSSDRTTGAAPPAAGPAATGRRSVPASPPARLLAAHLGVDLADLVPGSGIDGVVIRDDVAAARPRPQVPSRSPSIPVPDLPGTRRQVHGLRARLVDRLTRAQTVPTASAAVWADAGGLLRRRDELRAGGDPDVAAVTPFALILAATVTALRHVPELNGAFDEAAGEIRVFDPIHLGIAVDTDRGLVVPVLRDADRRSLPALVHELERLARDARAGVLEPGELVGSTFSVSNFGAFGLDEGTPMLNPPEAAILGVGALADRPVAVGGALAVRPTVRLSCTFDHRVTDGAAVGRFLERLRALIEAPV